jgi:hypothetical protein
MSLAAVHIPHREELAAKVQRLQREAKSLARDHSRELIAALAEVERIAMEIAVQGEPYLPGVVNEARIQAEEAGQRMQRLDMILGRAG